MILLGKEIVEKIHQLQREQGLSVRALAIKADMDPNTAAWILRGKTQAPKWDNVVLLLRALDHDVQVIKLSKEAPSASPPRDV